MVAPSGDSADVLGTLVDIGCSFLGGVGGLFLSSHFGPGLRQQLRYLLALAAIVFGMKMTWDHCSGGFLHIAWQYVLGMILLVAGNAAGLLFRLQRTANRVEQSAETLSNREPLVGSVATATAALTLTPLLFIGTLAESALEDPRPIFLKSVLDGLLLFGLAEKYRWPVLIGVIPLALVQGSVSFALTHWNLESVIRQNGLNALGLTAGLILLCCAVAIAEVRRANVLNYLPALILAPLAGQWW